MDCYTEDLSAHMKAFISVCVAAPLTRYDHLLPMLEHIDGDMTSEQYEETTGTKLCSPDCCDDKPLDPSYVRSTMFSALVEASSTEVFVRSEPSMSEDSLSDDCCSTEDRHITSEDMCILSASERLFPSVYGVKKKRSVKRLRRQMNIVPLYRRCK